MFTEPDMEELAAQVKAQLIPMLRALDGDVCDELAAYSHRLFDAFMNQGFSHEEAIELVASMGVAGKK